MKTNMNSKLILIIIVLVVVAIGVYMSSNGRAHEVNTANIDKSIPRFLINSFPNTDWSKVDPSVYGALSGGPSKDGIPALDAPKFEALEDVEHPNTVQTIVMKDGDTVKVYPYNIIVWHEIVNDTVNGVPVSVTFCPLCGSAVVYSRTLPDGLTTFGVSGSLIESNMVMYDRATESLWQQSTGKAIAGKYLGEELELQNFQLLTFGEVKEEYPDALVLSTDTGHRRDYESNPYGGYEESDNFIFDPSVNDNRYQSKTIFVAFKIDGTPVSVPWLEIKEGETYTTKINNQDVSLKKENKELTITNASGTTLPFYFEMWFSWAVQHQDTGIVFDPSK